MLRGFVLILLITSYLQAQADEGYRIVSLLEKDALVTKRLLPFKVYNSSGQAMPIKQVDILGECVAMVDMHYEDIFHIQCENDSAVQGVIELKDKSRLSLDTFVVRKVGRVFSLPGNDPEIRIDPNKPSERLGNQLFVNHCLSCHRTQPIQPGKTTEDLLEAFEKPEMKNAGLAAIFSNDRIQLESIVLYINRGAQ